MVATFRASDSYPKETYVYHAAGLGGYGTASYIDSVVLRDRDMTNGWLGAADGTLEERIYYCQNWRHDVSAVLNYTSGQIYQAEQIRYSTYGTPFGLPVGDLDSDGTFSQAEYESIQEWNTGYDVRADANLDGEIDEDDAAYLADRYDITLGRTVMSQGSIANRKGFRGWDNDGVLGDGDGIPGIIATGTSWGNSRFWVTKFGVFDSRMGRALSKSIEDESAWWVYSVPANRRIHGDDVLCLGDAFGSAQVDALQSPAITMNGDGPWGPTGPGGGFPSDYTPDSTDPCYFAWRAKRSAENNVWAAFASAIATCKSLPKWPFLGGVGCIGTLLWYKSALDGLEVAAAGLRTCCTSLPAGTTSMICAVYMQPTPVVPGPPRRYKRCQREDYT